MSGSRLDRRTLLRGALAVAGSGTLLTACGGGGGGGGTGGTGGSGQVNEQNAAVELPTYTPFTNGPKPDLAGTPQGVLDGFLRHPAEPVAVTTGKPGDGSAVTVFTQTYSPVPPGLSGNTYWQAMNDALGVDLKVSVVPASDYSPKFATVVAGNELPDLLHVRTSVVDIPALMKAKCQDLTEFLGGDAVKDYPFLANIPEVVWRVSCVHNGAIYGIPIPRAVMGGVFYRRDDLIVAKSLNPDPGTFAEFRQLCLELTDPRKSVWAIVSAATVFGFIQAMLGLPNTWRNEGGKLTHVNELEETKQAIDDTAKLWKLGVIHPDSFGGANVDMTVNYKQWFNEGSAIFTGDNWTAWPQFYAQNTAGPSFRVGGMLPPDYDASTKAVTWQGNPAFSFTAFKKASPDRIKLLLHVCDWLAAPFGSTEYLLKYFGVEGQDWERKDGDPVLTSKGQSEVPGLAVNYLAAPPYPLYYGGQAQATKDGHAFQAKFIPKSVADPTLGLYSKTAARQGSALTTTLTDTRDAIIQGRKPMSAWDEAVQAWRSAGGDQLRGEFEDALAKNS